MKATRVEEVVLPLPPDEAWAVLADTPRMIAMDPVLESFEPEGGVLTEGELNHVASRLGPLWAKAVSRTAVLDPPHRAVFESVKPHWPLRIRTEDALEEVEGGTRHRVTTELEASDPVGWAMIRPMAGFFARTRRELMRRLQAELGDRG